MLRFESVSVGNQRSGNGTQPKKQSARPVGPATAVFQVLCEEISIIGRNRVQRLYQGPQVYSKFWSQNDPVRMMILLMATFIQVMEPEF